MIRGDAVVVPWPASQDWTALVCGRIAGSINGGNVGQIRPQAFRECQCLKMAEFPVLSVIPTSAFYYCKNLLAASFPAAVMISAGAFMNCSRLMSIYLPGSSVCQLQSQNAFSYTPMMYSMYWSKWGTIYVPASLYSAYISASVWRYYSGRFRSIS